MVTKDQFNSSFEDNLFPVKKTLHIKGKLHYFAEPWIMGIINITPDSFFSASRSLGKKEETLKKAGKMLEDGASILDIGGYSSRPNAIHISIEEELKRVIPVIRSIKEVYPQAIVSIDTFRHEVAEKAVWAGADIVNDISGGQLDKRMIPVVGKLAVPFICMHMRGNPGNMQDFTIYDNLEKEIVDYFSIKMKECREAGIKDVILDLGFGFAKTLDQNYQLLKNLNHFSLIGVPILVGISRKSMIYKYLGGGPLEALNGTTALNMAALIGGAEILRVHDVKEAKETIDLFKKIYH
ncbi:MAG TPA: dihydropteroate synthase [Lunatimonas sp.]|nr:dihydropteroate synthase [Lunatimonas sp.]